MNDEIAERMILVLQDIARATARSSGGVAGRASTAATAAVDSDGSAEAKQRLKLSTSVSSAATKIGEDVMAGEGIKGASALPLVIAVTTAVTKAIASSFAQGTMDQWSERKTRPQELLRAYATESGRAGILRTPQELQKFHDLNVSLGRSAAANLGQAMQIAGYGPKSFHEASSWVGENIVYLANKLKNWTSANAQIHDASKAEGK